MSHALAEQPLTVPGALRPWITDIVSVSVAGALPESFTHVPETATHLVVRAEGDARRDTLVVGPRTRASYHVDADKRVTSCVRLRLAPGAARTLLGVPARDLVGRVAPLGGLPTPTARRLAGVLSAPETGELIPRLTEVLHGRLAPHVDPSRDRVLRAAVDALSTRPDRLPAQVQDVARELAVSERQLRNLFADGVGVSPKHFARIHRLRHVLAHAATAPWAQLASDSGYYDQSHLTADFRTLMGVPPTAFFTGRLPEARPCEAVRGL
ncbi:AraC family transcriptional regulator [Streptomyces adustus]|uniref:AraC family transcriptional regulator n=1 Tax=Streptomyces adustus TaxID=1609272 RepID=UPI003713F644